MHALPAKSKEPVVTARMVAALEKALGVDTGELRDLLQRGGVHKLAYSPTALCRMIDLSPRFLRHLSRIGKGPKITRVGRQKILITHEDAIAWLRSMAEPPRVAKQPEKPA
jgi:hypothetical protein